MRQTQILRDHIKEMASSLGPDGLSELLGVVRGILRERGLEPECGRAREPRPLRMFSVPEGVRNLTSEQSALLPRAANSCADSRCRRSPSPAACACDERRMYAYALAMGSWSGAGALGLFMLPIIATRTAGSQEKFQGAKGTENAARLIMSDDCNCDRK